MSMCVLHVAESLIPEAGSVAITLPGLFRALDQNGVQSAVLTADGSTPQAGDVNCRCHDVADATQAVAQVDLLHLHGWGGDSFRSVAKIARKGGKPYVISPQGGMSEGTHRKKGWRDQLRGLLGENSLIRGALAVVALNEFEHKDFRDRRPNKSAVLLPYGLDFPSYRSTDDRLPDLADVPEGRILLFLGPIHPIEGLVPLLKTFGELAFELDDWSIVIAGMETGDWRRMLEAAVRRKGGTERVRFVNAPDVATQRAWLGKSTILASPSLHIRCPVSIMQAVATGVTVVSSNRVVPEGLAKVVRTCEPNRTQLKQGLRSAMTLAEDERISATQKARDVAESLYDWSVLAQRYVELYQS
ncbi:MAG: glycosyltransferase [Phycisphaerales bacterium]|nr:MAG: glycosyltransferase [Phycisphaerales bacterium]